MSHPCAYNVRMEHASSYQPSAFFFRQAIRRAKTKAELTNLALLLCLELENHKAFIREEGLIPPKKFILPSEAYGKNWTAEIVPLSALG